MAARRPVPDGDLSPRHPWGQPRPQATQGRTRPVGSAAPHDARHHARRAAPRAHQDPPPLQPAGPPDRPVPDPARGRRHRAWRVWIFIGVLGRHPGARRAAPGSTTAGPSRPDAAEELDIRITLDSADELFRSDLQIDGVSVLEDLEPEADGRTLRIRPAELVESELVEQALAEGEHRIELSVGRMFLGDSTFTWSYVVDSIAPTLDVPGQPRRRCRSTSPSRSRARSRRAWSCGSTTSPIDNDDGSFAVDFDSPPTGSLAVRGDRRGRQPHAEARGRAGRLPGDVPRRARERGGLGRRRAARRDRGPDRPRPDRHRRARPQGRVGDRRLRLRAGQGQGDRRRHRRLRPLRDGRATSRARASG